MNRIFPLYHIFVVAAIVCSCRNPFMPGTGVPVDYHSEDQRSTPQGVIEQLIESYESRRIDLFEEILPKDGSFRFFVAPTFHDADKGKYTLKETRDTRLRHIDQSEYYYYWEQVVEVDAHDRLFTQAERIRFELKPVLSDIRKFIDNGDTAAEVLLEDGELRIGRWVDADTVELYTVPITKQVFLLEKDEDDLWVIKKWYDFSIGS